MPELPEIETLKCYLEQHILGKKINKVILRRNNLRYPIASDFSQCTINTSIIRVERLAKYLLINLDNEYSLIIHLGMSGRFTVKDANHIPLKHDHIIITLDNGSCLVFNDARRFGMIYCCSSNELSKQKFLKNLGKDPMSPEFDTEYLYNNLKTKKMPIKNAIMNNQIAVGVGNIYASESLFKAQINPLLSSNKLNFQQISDLVSAIKEILSEAIKAGGTTLRDFVNGNNAPGYFKQKLQVYGRYNEKCYICNGNIDKIKQAGRTSFFCPNCQK